MTRVWVVMESTHDGDKLQGLFASMDAVRRAFPKFAWEDISDEHGQTWKATLPADDENPWGNEFFADLRTVTE